MRANVARRLSASKRRRQKKSRGERPQPREVRPEWCGDTDEWPTDCILRWGGELRGDPSIKQKKPTYSKGRNSRILHDVAKMDKDRQGRFPHGKRRRLSVRRRPSPHTPKARVSYSVKPTSFTVLSTFRSRLCCLLQTVTAGEAHQRIGEESLSLQFIYYQFLRQATDGDEKTTKALPLGTSKRSSRRVTSKLNDAYIGRNAATWVQH